MKSFRLIAIILSLAGSSLLAQSNPVPLIQNPLVPNSAAPDSPGFTLTVNGTGFVAGSTVNWDGIPLATSFVNNSQLTANVPPAKVGAAGTASVTVTNPAPGGGGSDPAFFTVTNPLPAMGYPALANPTGYGGWIIASDLNQDGNADLIVTSLFERVQNIAVLMGNGDGTFQPAVYYTAGERRNPLIDSGWIVAGDFNNDGFPDLAAVSATSENNPAIFILLNRGDGTFGAAQGYPAGAGAWNLATGDFNRDGHLDIVVANPLDNDVGVYLGNGDGTFQLPLKFPNSNAANVNVGDFNGDGILDLLVSSFGGFNVMFGNGDGTFQAPSQFRSLAVTNPPGIADLNGDGILDAVVELFGDGGFTVLLGNGDGSFRQQGFYAQEVLTGISVADLDGDGKLDLAVSGAAAMVSVYKGNGDGTFQQHFLNFATGSSEPFTMVAADFNNDGRMDLATANSFNDTVSVLSQSPTVLSPVPLAFGTVSLGDSATRNVILRNGAAVALTLSEVRITAPSDFVEVNDCGSSVPPGGTCRFSVTFTPSGFGRRTAGMYIKDSSSSSPQLVPLTGTGAAR
jgi:hypothetical protein